MPACNYCERRFEDEESYLEHLAEQHYEELGRIDKRRVTDAEESGSSLPLSIGPLALVSVIGLAAAIVAYLLFFGAGSGGEAASLPDEGDEELLSDVENYPSEGNEHVNPGTEVEYETMPPTSGPHYSSTTEAGFYEETPPLGELIHSLEHGAVVIYYDPTALSPEAEEHLQELATTYTDPFASVIVVPHPEDDPDSPYVLTAWQNKLEMDSYDQDVVEAFLAEFLGRGPENPVR